MEFDQILTWIKQVLPESNAETLGVLAAKLFEAGFKTLQKFEYLQEKDIIELHLLNKVETRMLMHAATKEFGADGGGVIQLHIKKVEFEKWKLDAEQKQKELAFEVSQAKERNVIERETLDVRRNEKDIDLKIAEERQKSQEAIEKMISERQKTADDAKYALEHDRMKLEYKNKTEENEIKKMELANSANEAMLNHKKRQVSGARNAMIVSAAGTVAACVFLAPISLPALAVGATAGLIAEGVAGRAYWKNSVSSNSVSTDKLKLSLGAGGKAGIPIEN